MSNTQECIAAVKKHSNTTRVFTFGIGSAADKVLVSGIAEGDSVPMILSSNNPITAGEGNSEFIIEGEAMDDKVMRQLKRALQPALTDLKVDWGVFKSAQPAPFRMPPLFCGNRLIVYAYIKEVKRKENTFPLPFFSMPKKKIQDEEGDVTITANTAVKPFSAQVKVNTKTATSGDVLHKIAAKKLIK